MVDKINVYMDKKVHEKAKEIQTKEKLISISVAIEKALDYYNSKG